MKHHARNCQSNQPVLDQATAIWWSLKRARLVHLLHSSKIRKFEWRHKSNLQIHVISQPGSNSTILFLQLRLRPHYAGEIWKRSYISTVRPTVHNYLSRREWSFFENALQTREIWKRGLCVVLWTENSLKTELFENEDITITTPSFPQTQIQNDRWLLRF